MAKDIIQIREHVAEDHPQIADVIGREGLNELVNLIEDVIEAKMDKIERDAQRQKDN